MTGEVPAHRRHRRHNPEEPHPSQPVAVRRDVLCLLFEHIYGHHVVCPALFLPHLAVADPGYGVRPFHPSRPGATRLFTVVIPLMFVAGTVTIVGEWGHAQLWQAIVSVAGISCSALFAWLFILPLNSRVAGGRSGRRSSPRPPRSALARRHFAPLDAPQRGSCGFDHRDLGGGDVATSGQGRLSRLFGW